MERRLIYANALMKNVGKIPQLRGITYGRMKKAVEETTTIDAVEVVRCKDCEYNEGIPMPVGFLYCSRTDSVVKEDDYCSYGWRA